MIDIDDTLIDGNESVVHGFQFMQDMYHAVSMLYPIHIVTARPRDQHAVVMQMLQAKGFSIPPDRLHMLPTDDYGKSSALVEDFKWKAFCKISLLHSGVIARFGDRLWDVAHIDSLHDGTFDHVRDKDGAVFMEQRLGSTLSGKLPGS